MKDALTTWSRTRPKEKTQKTRRLLDRRGRRDTPTSVSSPPGLRDAFSIQRSWMDRGRKYRNRQQCSGRRGCFDMRGTVLGSLWGDFGAEANSLPEKRMQWISLKPSPASKSGRSSEAQGEIQSLREARGP